MNPYGELKIENIILVGNNSQHAFASLKDNMSSLYNLTVSECEISNFNYVLKAYKESMSDKINFVLATLKNCTNNIELSEATNDKGNYNVTQITNQNYTRNQLILRNE